MDSFNETDNQCLDNINNQLLNTLDIGNNTLITLNCQREILINTEKKMDKIDTNLNISDKIITRMNNFYKRISSIFFKPHLNNQNDATNIVSVRGQGSPLAENPNITESSTENLESPLDILSNNAKKLREISEIINTELKLHNDILNSIDEKTDISTNKLNKINKNINKLL